MVSNCYSDFYAQCRPIYPADIIHKSLDYSPLKVYSS